MFCQFSYHPGTFLFYQIFMVITIFIGFVGVKKIEFSVMCLLKEFKFVFLCCQKIGKTI